MITGREFVVLRFFAMLKGRKILIYIVRIIVIPADGILRTVDAMQSSHLFTRIKLIPF
jgi:hypothetical protein